MSKDGLHLYHYCLSVEVMTKLLSLAMDWIYIGSGAQHSLTLTTMTLAKKLNIKGTTILVIPTTQNH